MKREIYGVICYWKYVPPKPEDRRNPRQLWKCVEAYQIDDDGNPLTDPKNKHWLYKKGDMDDPIPGRAVTVWHMMTGVRLRDMNLPDYVPFLSYRFVDKIKELPNWYDFLHCGYDLLFGTANEVEKIMNI